MRVSQLAVGGGVLVVGDLPVESHDGADRVALGNEPQLRGSKVVLLAHPPRFLLLHLLDVDLAKVFYSKLHDKVPNIFAVIEYFLGFLLLLSGVEVAPDERDNDVFEDPLQGTPKNELVLLLEILRILVSGTEPHPVKVIDPELLQERCLGEGLIPVEADEFDKSFLT